MSTRKAGRTAARRLSSRWSYCPRLELLEDRLAPAGLYPPGEHLLARVVTHATAGAAPVTAGVVFTVDVSAEDASGNLDTTFGGSVAIGLANSPAGGTLGGTLTAQAVNGVAEFRGLTINTAGAGYTIRAATAGLDPVATGAINVTQPGVATRLVVSTQPPASVVAGQGFGLVVTAEDGLGTIDMTFNDSVTLALGGAAGPGAAGALGGTVTVTAVHGVADFSNLHLDQAGTFTLNVTSHGLDGTTTQAVTVSPATASRLAVLGPSGNVLTDAPFSLQVEAEDAFGNVEASFNGSVTIALAGNPTGAVLGGTLTEQAVNGVASFSGLTINKAGNGYTIAATSSGLGSVTSPPFNVTDDQLVITAPPPGSFSAGSGFGLTVAAEDASGQVDTSFNGSVTVAAVGPSGAVASLGGSQTVTAVNGVATFSGLSMTVAGDYGLVASGGGLGAGSTDAVIITGSAATHLAVTTQPPPVVTAGVGFCVVVSAEDANGNVDPNFSGTVTIALGRNPGGATLGGTLTEQAVNGVAIFSGLTVNAVGTGYTLRATTDGLAGVTTSSFDVKPVGAATQLAVTTQPPASVTAGAAFGLVVRAEDGVGALVTSFNGNVTLTLDNLPGSNGTLNGTRTVRAVNGVAVFSGLSIDQVGQGYTLQVTSSGLTPTTTNPFDVTADVATQLVLVSGPQTLPAGVPSGPVTVQLEDASGNVAQAGSGGVVVSLGTSSHFGGFLDAHGQALTSVLIAAGFSTASFEYEDTLAGSPTLTMTATGMSSATQQETVDAGAPSAVVFTTAPQTLAPRHISAPIGVQLQDQFGNVAVAGAGGLTLTVSSTSAGGTFLNLPLVIGQGGSTGSFQYRDSQAGSPTLKVSAASFSATQTETITPASNVVFTSGNSTVFLAGQWNSFTVTTSGTPTAVLSENGLLPGGVSFVALGNGTAVLSGTPALTTGTYTFNIAAINGAPPGAVQVFSLTVAGPPAITSGGSATFVAGIANSFTVTTRPGLPTTTTLSESGRLPAGVVFVPGSNGTAVLRGTPAAGTGGVYSFVITASNGTSPNATQAFTLTVKQAPAFTSAAGVTFATGQSNSFTVTTRGTPTAALSWAGTLPGGVSFTDNGNGTATLSGNPAANAGGTYRLTLRAGNGLMPDATQTFTLTVDRPPTITSGAGATFTVGSAGSFTVTTTPGTPAATTLSESGALPAGVAFVPASNGTAALRGTPAAGSGGTYTLTLTATNAPGSRTTQTFTLTVKQAPSITSAASATFVTGQSNSFTVTTKGYPTAAITRSGNLPVGVTLTDNGNGTATLSGNPAAGGTYLFTVNAGNGTSPGASQTFKLIVDQPPRITSANGATFAVGVAGSFTVTTLPGNPAATTLTYSGRLPGGVTFTPGSNGTAVLRGTPAAGSGGTYTLTLTATNAPGSKTTQTFTLAVNQGTSITSAASATFVTGQLNSFTVTTRGYPAAAITKSGNLPAGVTLIDNGNGTATLSGNPAHTGTYTFSLRAGNGLASDATQNFTLIVDQPPTITSANSTTFAVGTSGSFTVTTAPGVPTTTTLSVSGTLPRGVFFSSGGVGTAVLKGTPAAGSGGTYTVTLTASNAPGSRTAQTFTLNVNEAPSITSAATATFTVGQSGSFTVSTKGFPAATLSETGNLPGGVDLIDNGDGTATLSGTPMAGAGGKYTFTIRAANGISTGATQSFTLVVNQPPIITSAPSTNFAVNQSGSFTITTTGFPVGAIKVLGTLPAGVTLLNKGDGTAVLSGRPTVRGVYTFTIEATDGLLAPAFQAFVLTVA